MSASTTPEKIPLALPHPALPGADWGDAYRVRVEAPFDHARAAAQAAFNSFPPWALKLMTVRNAIVARFGLKTSADDHGDAPRIGRFPLIAEEDAEVVLGVDDRHLDFRCVLSLAPAGAAQEVTLATLVKRHNPMGRAYLAAIMPFHEAIIRATLKRLAMRAR